MIFSTHFSATKIPTPPKPDVSPDHKNLHLQCLPVIILVEQPLKRVSWTAQISILLLAKVSTISLALSYMVPTFRDAIRSLNLLCWNLHDIDLTGPTFPPALLLMTPSLKVPVPLFLTTILDMILKLSGLKQKFNCRMPFLTQTFFNKQNRLTGCLSRDTISPGQKSLISVSPDMVVNPKQLQPNQQTKPNKKPVR